MDTLRLTLKKKCLVWRQLRDEREGRLRHILNDRMMGD